MHEKAATIFIIIIEEIVIVCFKVHIKRIVSLLQRRLEILITQYSENILANTRFMLRYLLLNVIINKIYN